eukprot:gene23571-biopygen8714
MLDSKHGHRYTHETKDNESEKACEDSVGNLQSQQRRGRVAFLYHFENITTYRVLLLRVDDICNSYLTNPFTSDKPINPVPANDLQHYSPQQFYLDETFFYDWNVNTGLKRSAPRWFRGGAPKPSWCTPLQPCDGIELPRCPIAYGGSTKLLSAYRLIPS